MEIDKRLFKTDYMVNILISTFSSYYPETFFKGNGDQFLFKMNNFYLQFKHHFLDSLGFDKDKRGINQYLSFYLSAEWSLLAGLENICPDYRFRIASFRIVNPLRKNSLNILGPENFNFFREKGKEIPFID